MKIYKLIGMAVVAIMLGLSLSSCEKESEDLVFDYSQDILGTWTCFQDNYINALQINSDGTVLSTGKADDKVWMKMKGKVQVKNDIIRFSYEDGTETEYKFQVVSGKSMAIIDNDGSRALYNFCSENYSENILGMWITNNNVQKADEDENMIIQTFKENGKVLITGLVPISGEAMINAEGSYDIIGDMLIVKSPQLVRSSDMPSHAFLQIAYRPNSSALGDTIVGEMKSANTTTKQTWLRVKEGLNLQGKKCDYSSTYITNVKGADKNIEFMGQTFNFAQMNGVKLDKMMKAVLFSVEFTDDKTLKYGCHYNGTDMIMEAPIVVEGNKMTVQMSKKDSACRDIEMYAFQDASESQMHMYMPTHSFVNFFSNMQIAVMSHMGTLDKTNASAVDAVFNDIDEVVETINFSLVMKKAK